MRFFEIEMMSLMVTTAPDDANACIPGNTLVKLKKRVAATHVTDTKEIECVSKTHAVPHMRHKKGP